jgi:hypothetical protein
MLLLIAGSMSVYFIVTEPVAFKYAVTIKKYGGEWVFEGAENRVNIDGILRRIPYNSGATVYEVRPEERYRKTIVQGNGNCSNLVFGLAYLLSEEGYPYQIVHILQVDGFLSGIGHTVIDAPIMLDGNRLHGIVDVLEGGGIDGWG